MSESCQGSGTTGISGVINTANSFVGSAASSGISPHRLDNGNYLISQPNWNCTVARGCAASVATVGAVTWASGTTGIIGTATTSNSLVGTSAGDTVGNGVILLTNDAYIVTTSNWSCTIAAGCASKTANVGAATWSSATAAITGSVNTANGIVGVKSGQASQYNMRYIFNSYDNTTYIAPVAIPIVGSLL